MRDIPDWGIGLIVGFSIVAGIFCLQLCILMIVCPVWYGVDYFAQRRFAQRLRDGEVKPDEPEPASTELAISEETAADFEDVLHKPYNGKAKVYDMEE